MASGPLRFIAYACGAIFLASVSSAAHPHDEAEIFQVTGIVTTVDVVNRIIAVDTVDKTTKTSRNLLFFVDPKIRIRNGKTRVGLAELQPGRRVTCIVERQHQEGRDDRHRLVVFEIRLDVR
jgi:hypothetical protein